MGEFDVSCVTVFPADLSVPRLFDYPDREGDWMFEPHPDPFPDDGRPKAEDEGPDKYRPDISKPNPAFFAHVDRVVKLAADLGITVMFLPTWARWVNGGYWGRPILFDETIARGWGEFLGERYPFHPWVIGGDGNRYWNPDIKSLLIQGKQPDELEVTDFGAVFEAMAHGILEGEKKALARVSKDVQSRAAGYKTFMTFHPAQRMSLLRLTGGHKLSHSMAAESDRSSGVG